MITLHLVLLWNHLASSLLGLGSSLGYHLLSDLLGDLLHLLGCFGGLLDGLLVGLVDGLLRLLGGGGESPSEGKVNHGGSREVVGLLGVRGHDDSWGVLPDRDMSPFLGSLLNQSILL